MNITISEAAKVLSAVDARMKYLDQEITDMAVKIATMQEHRACLSEECRALEMESKRLMYVASFS